MRKVLALDSPIQKAELDPRRFPKTRAAIRKAVEGGVTPGAVVGLWEAREPERVLLAADGRKRLDVEARNSSVQVDTIFDLASVSKVVAAAPLAAVLVERGWISWNTSLAAIFPEYPYPEIELRHLLSHTAGFVAWEPFYEKIRDRFAPKPLYQVPVSARQDAMREFVLAAKPDVPVGTRTLYSDISFLLLGFALEKIVDLPLDEAVRRFVWEPMRVGAFEYRKTTEAPTRTDPVTAATEKSPWHGTVLQGQVHDENCWAMGGYGGHAGVFGRAEDVLKFARAIAVTDFLTPATRKAMWTRVDQPADSPRTLGWDTPSGTEPSASRLFSGRTVGHLGFTGTSLWIDLDAGIAVTLLTNRVHPTRENIGIRVFRPELHEAIRSDLGY